MLGHGGVGRTARREAGWRGPIGPISPSAIFCVIRSLHSRDRETRLTPELHRLRLALGLPSCASRLHRCCVWDYNRSANRFYEQKEIHKPKKQPAAVLGSLGSRSSFLRRPADRACLSGSRALSSTRRHCGCSALVRGHRQRRRHRASSRATWRHDPRHRASARAAARQGPHLRAIRHRRARRGHALELCRALAAMRPPRHHVCRTRRLVSLVRGRLRPPG